MFNKKMILALLAVLAVLSLVSCDTDEVAYVTVRNTGSFTIYGVIFRNDYGVHAQFNDIINVGTQITYEIRFNYRGHVYALSESSVEMQLVFISGGPNPVTFDDGKLNIRPGKKDGGTNIVLGL